MWFTWLLTLLLTTLGSAVDMTAHDLTVETYFPMDPATVA
jgi:hypothetical protein